MQPDPTSPSDLIERSADGAAALELVVAVSDNNVIGRANQLPWRLPEDLRHFKRLTWGLPILMGRKTHQSIGKALPGRMNLVLSRTSFPHTAGSTVVRSLDEARILAGVDATVMVIGGGEVYRQCISLARRIHLTRVHMTVKDGDTFFSEWRDPLWHTASCERHTADEKHAVDYSFVTLTRSAQGDQVSF